MNPRALTALIFALLALAGVGTATTYNALTLEEQVQKAQVVVHASITAATVDTSRGRLPWTVYAIEAKRYLRGSNADLQAKLGDKTVTGFGVLGGNNVRLEGAPTFKPGDEVVLLLYTRPYDSPIVGFRQGAYYVNAGKIVDAGGKAVPLTVGGNRVDATLDAFLTRLEALVVGR